VHLSLPKRGGDQSSLQRGCPFPPPFSKEDSTYPISLECGEGTRRLPRFDKGAARRHSAEEMAQRWTERGSTRVWKSFFFAFKREKSLAITKRDTVIREREKKIARGRPKRGSPSTLKGLQKKSSFPSVPMGEAAGGKTRKPAARTMRVRGEKKTVGRSIEGGRRRRVCWGEGDSRLAGGGGLR